MNGNRRQKAFEQKRWKDAVAVFEGFQIGPLIEGLNYSFVHSLGGMNWKLAHFVVFKGGFLALLAVFWRVAVKRTARKKDNFEDTWKIYIKTTQFSGNVWEAAKSYTRYGKKAPQ